MHSGRHPAGRRQRPCLACAAGFPVPGYLHHCAIGAEASATLRDDFLTLVSLGGEPYARPLREHEIHDMKIQEADDTLPEDCDLTGARAEIEPTDDYGMRRRYVAANGTVLRAWTIATGATARKWTTR
jgi:hypothetical protein